MLAGAETSAARSSSTSAALSELTHAYSRLLRRGQPLRELGLSSGERASHRSCASGISLSSCGRILAGAGRGCGSCPPTNEGSAEVATSTARLLRRGHPIRELGLSSGERVSHRSWASGNNRSSCQRMLAGASASAARFSSGERGLVGADAPIQPPAPAKPPLIGGAGFCPCRWHNPIYLTNLFIL